MVRDRGRHSLQARGRHTLVLWEQGVKKTERGRKEKQSKTEQNNPNQENNNANSEQGPCVTNSSDISLKQQEEFFYVGIFIWASCYPIC